MTTSLDSPIRVDFVTLDLPGRIGMTFAPGKKGPGMATPANAAWARDLETDLTCLRDVFGVRRLVTLMETQELERFGIPDLVARAGALGIDVIHFPIVDGGAPSSPEAIVDLVGRVLSAARAGETIVVHCRGGLGRTGTLVACALVGLGRSAAEAIAQVRAARPGTVESGRQERFVEVFAGVARGRFASGNE